MVDTVDSLLRTIMDIKPGLEELSGDTRFEELRLDSLDEVEILLACERQYMAPITHGQLNACATLEDLARLIDQKRGRSAPR